MLYMWTLPPTTWAGQHPAPAHRTPHTSHKSSTPNHHTPASCNRPRRHHHSPQHTTAGSGASHAGDGAGAASRHHGIAQGMAQGTPCQGVDDGEASRVVGGGDEAGILLQAVKVGVACRTSRAHGDHHTSQAHSHGSTRKSGCMQVVHTVKVAGACTVLYPSYQHDEHDKAHQVVPGGQRCQPSSTWGNQQQSSNMLSWIAIATGEGGDGGVQNGVRWGAEGWCGVAGRGGGGAWHHSCLQGPCGLETTCQQLRHPGPRPPAATHTPHTRRAPGVQSHSNSAGPWLASRNGMMQRPLLFVLHCDGPTRTSAERHDSRGAVTTCQRWRPSGSLAAHRLQIAPCSSSAIYAPPLSEH